MIITANTCEYAYEDDGGLMITRELDSVDPNVAAARYYQASSDILLYPSKHGGENAEALILGSV